MADSLRGLAGDFKRFLAAQEEDEFLTTAAPVCAADSVCAPGPVSHAEPVENTSALPPMAAGSTLTVEFPRTQAQQAAPQAEPEEPFMNKTDKTRALQELSEVIKSCTRCPLGATRINAVPGEGNVNADVMFVGEGPGFDEDRQGRPFVGRAGQLLDKMILAMGLTREKVFIANIAKCHPMTDPLHPEKHGNDRAPNAQEIACCRKYIEQQIAIVCPKYVVALGGVAAKSLISDASSLGALRGKFHNLHLDSVELPKPVQILATFHPAALLRNPNWKKDAWKDLQMVMDKLGLQGARK